MYKWQKCFCKRRRWEETQSWWPPSPLNVTYKVMTIHMKYHLARNKRTVSNLQKIHQSHTWNILTRTEKGSNVEFVSLEIRKVYSYKMYYS